MPSFSHEIILELFRNRPELAPLLLRDVLRAELPEYTQAKIIEASLNEIQPTEYRADLVVLLHKGASVFGIVVEAQLHKDPDKLYSWPTYAALLRSRHRCPVCVLVFAGDELVADWARKPIDLGSGNRFRAWVLSPRGVPVIADEQDAAADPELAVLSVVAHGAGPDHDTAVRVALAAQFGSLGLDADRARMYCDLIFNSLTDAARSALMNMNPAKYEYQSEFAKRYVAEGRAEVLIRLLTRRFGELPDKALAQVRAASRSEIEEMADRVLTGTSLEEVLGER